MITHRTLEGGWAECFEPDSCRLLFHFPGMTPEQMGGIPEYILWDMLDLLDPPDHISEEGFPSVSWYRSRRDWVNSGVRHRDYDLPAQRLGPPDDQSYHWCQFDKYHREDDKPAWIGPDGSKAWYRRGQRHRENDLPALIRINEVQEWWVHDERHRDGGKPAVIYADGTVEYWVKGERVR